MVTNEHNYKLIAAYDIKGRGVLKPTAIEAEECIGIWRRTLPHYAARARGIPDPIGVPGRAF
jgi:hypothetical protein